MFTPEKSEAMNLEQKPLISAVASTSIPDTCGHEDEWIALHQTAPFADEISGMVVRSVNMQRVLKTVQRLGPYKASVLIHGESGTGKELVARALHTLGPVPKGPFVTFNCS